MATTERYTHEDREGRLCKPLTNQPDEHGRIPVEYAEHLSAGRWVGPKVSDTLPALIHPRVRASLIGREVRFTGNRPDGTPDQFRGVVTDESERGSEVEVQVGGGYLPAWLPRAVVTEVEDEARQVAAERGDRLEGLGWPELAADVREGLPLADALARLEALGEGQSDAAGLLRDWTVA